MLEDGAVIDDSNANLPSDSEEEEELIVAKIESINPIPTIRVDPKHTGIMSIDSNSKSPLIAAGLVDGWIQMFKYGEENEQVAQFNHHASGCRSVKFSSDGKLCFTASSDQSISVIDVQAQKIAFTVEKAHDCGVNVVDLYDDGILASGDDSGGMRIWDIRMKEAALKRKADKHDHSDFISAFLPFTEKSALLATGGDGRLSVWDIRQKYVGLNALSDAIEDELLSINSIKHGKMIVCGSGDGVLQFFKWGDFGDVCDRFPGHPGSVDSILSTDEPNVIITGAADSKIRIVQLFDHMLRSVVGKHGELPVEDLCWTFNRQAIISSSHENTIKFWDLKGAVEIEDDDESDEDDEEDEEADFSSNEEGEEIEEEEEDDDDDEDEEEESESENEDAKGDKPSRKRDSSDDDSDDDKPRKKSKTKKGMSASKFKFASSQASKSDFFSGF